MQRCDACRAESERLTFRAADPRWLCGACRQADYVRSTTGTSFVRGAAEPVAGRDKAVVLRKGY